MGRSLQVFDYTDYRQYLNDALPVTGEKRGLRRELAKFIGCQSGFISQVLNGLSDFSLEHGIKVAKFLQLSEEETQFLLLIIQLARAGNMELKNHLNKQVQAIISERKSIQKRIKVHKKLNEKNQARYYSNWIYAAVHTVIGIPEINTKSKISKRLNLSMEDVTHAVNFLIETGLIQTKNEILLPGKNRIHLSKNSPFITQHHNNWRLKAMSSNFKDSSNDIQYSGVITLSKQDGEKIQEIFLKAIENMEKVLSPSKDETIFALSLNYYEL